RKRKRLWGRPAGAAGGGTAGWGRGASGRLLWSGVAFLLFAGLAWLAYSTPQTRPSNYPVEYAQGGSFDYAASAPPGPVYPDGKVRAGDPVFLSQTHVVRFRFDYRFESPLPHEVQGSGSLTAVLQGSSGWSRSFVLQAPARFQGDRASLEGTLDLGQLASLIGQVEAATGLRNEQYKLVVRPALQVAGTLAGTPLSATYRPELDFNFTPLALSLVTGAAGQSGSDPLQPRGTSAINLTRDVPATLGVARLQVPVAGVRLVLPAFLLAALAALVFSWLQFLREGRRPEHERIRALYGDLLAEARDLGLGDRPRVVWVADMASLVRLAAQYERLVLHQEAPDGTHLYAVEDTDCVYCYKTTGWFGGADSFQAGELSDAGPASEVRA
ncbi:MAG: hypothetical protein K6U79_11370, partial [Firmicutes bacterium]|nr:hypothetical protein [Bacillota bacterium]